jgi:hypothetical protein
MWRSVLNPAGVFSGSSRGNDTSSSAARLQLNRHFWHFIINAHSASMSERNLSQKFSRAKELPRVLDGFELPANVATQTVAHLCSLRGFCESQARNARFSHLWCRIPRSVGPLARPCHRHVLQDCGAGTGLWDRLNGCTLLNTHKMVGLVAFFSSVLSLPSTALLLRAVTTNST